ncbi:MAG: hypothetical protein MZV63_51085 [Marinilabiliales bacterium]|nr:hypothetical protein [Marinilabiliales bacterium]
MGNAQDLKTDLTVKEVLEKNYHVSMIHRVYGIITRKLFEVTVFASNYVVKETIEIDRPE